MTTEHPQTPGPEQDPSQTQNPAQQLTPEATDQAAQADPTPAEPPSLEALLAERDDQLLRLSADLDNLRKRHITELASARQFAIESFAEALLPVGDSLEMALKLQDQTVEALRSGVELTLRQLQQALERGKMRAIEPVGEKFDPNRHQAVSMVDGATQDPPVAPGHVVQVLQKGYLIGERVLRPALVLVAQS